MLTPELVFVGFHKSIIQKRSVAGSGRINTEQNNHRFSQSRDIMGLKGSQQRESKNMF